MVPWFIFLRVFSVFSHTLHHRLDQSIFSALFEMVKFGRGEVKKIFDSEFYENMYKGSHTLLKGVRIE